jgi:hypothetical protein
MSNTLKADSAGFLIGGQPIKPSGAELSLLRGMRDDVQAIRKMLKGAKKEAGAGRGKAANDEVKGVRVGTASARQVVAIPSGRSGSSSATQKTVKAGHIDRVKEASELRNRANKPMVIAMPAARSGNTLGVERDSSGRFTGGSGRVDATNKTMGLLSEIKDRIGSVANLNGGDEVDPAIKAAHEIQGVAVAALSATKAVGSVMAPIGRSLFSKSTDTKLPFFRRIYAELRGLRREESTFNKAQLRTLNRIDGKESPTQGGSSLGMIGTMLMAALGPLMVMLTRIPVVGPILTKLASMVPALAGPKFPTSAAGGAASKAADGGGMLGKAASGAKGLLKRVPILGAALAAVGSGLGVYDSETDARLSRAEKDKKTGAAIGGGVGTIGGMMGGAAAGASLGALGGPIGIAIGGFIGGAAGAFFGEDAGKIIGETVGGWVTEVRNADIPGKISSAWLATTDTMSKTWAGGVSLFNDGMDKSSALLADAYSGLSDVLKNFGIDLPAAVQATMDAANAPKEKALGVASRAATVVKNSAVGRGASWVLGQTSKLFESGKGGAGTVSAGNGDHGGASYGTYQLSSKQGKVQDFLKGSKYADQFKGLEAGSEAFNSKWKEVAKNDPQFEASQHDYIKRTNFDPAVAGLKKDGIDLSGRGAAVQDALWSTSVQFGGGNKLFQNALKGRDHTKMSDAEIVSALQDYKLNNNDKLFASSSAGVRSGTARRAQDEKALLLAKAQEPVTTVAPVNVSPVNVAAAKVPKVDGSVPAPRIPDMPTQSSTQSYSSSSVTQTSPTVVVSGGKHMAGRDLSNRPIAHVATGGLSGSFS